MIAFLKGTVAGRGLSEAYLDVNGIGFAIGMSQNSLSKLPEIGQEALIKTFMHVTDSGISLFGFLSDDEKTLFEELISVNGVGPKMALAALSTYSSSDLAAAISSQDESAISKVPGVGKKIASRIILELKGRLDGGVEGLLPGSSGSSAFGSATDGAIEALLSMGFTQAESELALKGAPEGASIEEALKYALKRLGGA